MHRIVLAAVVTVAMTWAYESFETTPADACGVKLAVKSNAPRKKVAAKERATPVAADQRQPVNTQARARPVRARTSTRVARRAQPAPRPTPEPVSASPRVTETEPEPEPEPAAEPPRAEPKRTRVARTETPRAAEVPDRADPGPTAPIDVEIFFELNSTEVAAADVEEAVEWLIAHPRGRLIVEGHTDASGSKSYNMRLSRRRALAAKSKLIREVRARGHKARSSQLRIRAKGPTQLAYPDDDSKNRRVHIRRAGAR